MTDPAGGLRARAPGADPGRLPARHPDLRSAHGALSVRRRDAPVAPRRHLRLLPGRRVRIGHRRGRHLHPREPDPSAHRLRLVPQGPHGFRAPAELPRALVPRRSQPASADPGAPLVHRVPDRRRAVPEQRLRARRAPPHGLPAQSPRGLRDRGRASYYVGRGAYVAAAQRAKVCDRGIRRRARGARGARDHDPVLRQDGAQGARRQTRTDVPRELRRRSRRAPHRAEAKWWKLWLERPERGQIYFSSMRQYCLAALVDK